MKTIKSIIALLFVLLTARAALAWYDPSTQRWLSRDPIGEPGFQVLRDATAMPQVGIPVTMSSERWINRDSLKGASDKRKLYTFVSNNPENKIDPFGLKDVKNPQDCWETVEDFYCGDLKGAAKACCQAGLKALFNSVPGAQKYACNVQAQKCRISCGLNFEDDDNKKDACMGNCQLQQALCTVKSF